MLCVAIGCNSPFTTANLMCEHFTLCACVCVHMQRYPGQCFSLENDWSSFCRIGLSSSSWPRLFSQLQTRGFYSSFFFWLSVCYTSGGQRWEKHMRVTAWPFLLHLKSALMTGDCKNPQCQRQHFDILLQLSVFVWFLSNTGHGKQHLCQEKNKSSEQKSTDAALDWSLLQIQLDCYTLLHAPFNLLLAWMQLATVSLLRIKLQREEGVVNS